MNLNPERLQQTADMLRRTGARREDFEVRAPDGIVLRGWKVRPATANRNWVLLFHGVSDTRTGVLGVAEFLLKHGYSVVMVDARAHGKSGGEIAAYGCKERLDTVAITQALCSTESVRHFICIRRFDGCRDRVAIRCCRTKESKRLRRNPHSRACVKCRMTTRAWTLALGWERRFCGRHFFSQCARWQSTVNLTRHPRTKGIVGRGGSRPRGCVGNRPARV